MVDIESNRMGCCLRLLLPYELFHLIGGKTLTSIIDNGPDAIKQSTVPGIDTRLDIRCLRVVEIHVTGKGRFGFQFRACQGEKDLVCGIVQPIRPAVAG